MAPSTGVFLGNYNGTETSNIAKLPNQNERDIVLLNSGKYPLIRNKISLNILIFVFSTAALVVEYLKENKTITLILAIVNFGVLVATLVKEFKSDEQNISL